MTTGNENNMVMPVSPMYGGYGNNGLGFGGDWGWIILLLLIAGNGWGGFGGFSGYGMDGGLYPWMNQADITTSGFQNAQLGNQLTSIQSDLGDIQTQLCNGFAGVEQGANARQIANMQQSFANQTAMLQGFNNIQSQFADCCCENRLATCQTQNIVQNEGNATRFADANNTRDIIDSQTRGTQAILDKLCALELDGYKRENDNLRSQLNMATLRESQTAQNAFIANGFANEVDQLYNRLNSCPVPTTPVYGRTPIFTCNSNNGCGCGCGNF